MGFLFGPVPSRRLGLSLGVDIVPRKICTLDCRYCEAGRTTELVSDRRSFFDPKDLFVEFDRRYPEVEATLDVVTVTGSGEPTLNRDLADIRDGLKSRIRHPLAILTNGTLMDDPVVYDALLGFDIVVPSVDAVTESVFDAVNRPAPGVDMTGYLEALVAFSHEFTGRLFIEVLVVKGLNDSPEELAGIARFINRCRYEAVHLNTVYRPPAYLDAEGLNPDELAAAWLTLTRHGVTASPVGSFARSGTDAAPVGQLAERILALVSLRPCTKEELAAVFGADAVDAAVIDLASRNKVVLTTHGGSEFVDATTTSA